eukprot:3184994-Amphidinium_carterae.2
MPKNTSTTIAQNRFNNDCPNYVSTTIAQNCFNGDCRWFNKLAGLWVKTGLTQKAQLANDKQKRFLKLAAPRKACALTRMCLNFLGPKGRLQTMWQIIVVAVLVDRVHTYTYIHTYIHTYAYAHAYAYKWIYAHMHLTFK